MDGHETAAAGAGRRHDLDWARVLLFALLVVHHAAVGFAPFGAEIYGFANDRLGGDALSLAIYFSHTWRLPALFLIAGIGMWFAAGRGAGAGFMGRRLARLLGPALFGTFVLNLAAGWAIATARGEAPALWPFLRDWWLSPEPRQVMHLWFLYNLAIYTVLCWPFLGLRRRLAAPGLSVTVLTASLAAATTLVAVMGKPHAAALAGDGYQFFWYWALFAAGLALGAEHVRVLAWAGRRWPWLLGLGAASFLLEVGLLAATLDRDPALGAALASGGWAAEGLMPSRAPVGVIFAAAEGANAWLFSLTALGLCARYLPGPGPRLAALGRATFPVYVLHFPITIVGLALLARVDWPWPAELALLVAATYAGCAALYAAALGTGRLVWLIGGRPSAAPGRRRSGEVV